MAAASPADALSSSNVPGASSALLSVNNIEVIYDHVILVLKGVSLEVRPGGIVALLGANGAGKTTTLKMLATILRPTSGQVTIAGHDLARDRGAIRRVIGYMPDVCGLYEEMMVHEYLRFFAAVYGIRGAAATKAIDDALQVTGLESKAEALCGDLSRGMSQRLHLARVLLHDPKLLLLDEPASGLDPRARIEFKDLVLTLRAMGKTLIVSSHILSELGEISDSVAILEQSRLVYSGPVEDISEQVHREGRVFQVRVREEPAEGRSGADLVEIVRGMPAVDAIREGDRPGQIFVRFQPDHTDHHALNAELVRRGFKVEHFGLEQVRLEDAFLHITKGLVQ
ncbi:MAG: ABC transporter ATP-binding protein [Gammaproteobacteria bacterium]|nr:ABC transporter ATP-binding protein [Gammaproteobacteria bacterium]